MAFLCRQDTLPGILAGRSGQGQDNISVSVYDITMVWLHRALRFPNKSFSFQKSWSEGLKRSPTQQRASWWKEGHLARDSDTL
jgi:hypothetical protein